MIRTVRLLLLGTACFVAAIAVWLPAHALSAAHVPAPGSSAAPAKSCTSATYAYAGLFSNRPGTGIEATITMLAHSVVTQGHVAGWIGVGGLNAGPKGTTEWLQAGLATTEDGKTVIYAESVRTDGAIPDYQTLVSHVVPGKPYQLAVRTLPNRPESWQVLLNGRPVTAGVKLPGSEQFEPMAMSESWNGAPPPNCNGFSYRFAQLKIASRDGVWSALSHTTPLANKGYKIIDRTVDGFTAHSG